MIYRFLLLLVIIAELTACATQQPLTPVDNWQLYQQQLAQQKDWQFAGKVEVRAGDEADKARISWRQRGDDYRIRLSGTLGMGTTYINGGPQLVSLEQSGKAPISASSPEQLVYDQLGQDIPISHLIYWIRGIPDPSISMLNLKLSDTGTLSQLNQAGWTLRFTEYLAAGSWNMPAEILATRDDIELSFSIYDWTISEL